MTAAGLLDHAQGALEIVCASREFLYSGGTISTGFHFLSSGAGGVRPWDISPWLSRKHSSRNLILYILCTIHTLYLLPQCISCFFPGTSKIAIQSSARLHCVLLKVLPIVKEQPGVVRISLKYTHEHLLPSILTLMTFLRILFSEWLSSANGQSRRVCPALGFGFGLGFDHTYPQCYFTQCVHHSFVRPSVVTAVEGPFLNAAEMENMPSGSCISDITWAREIESTFLKDYTGQKHATRLDVSRHDLDPQIALATTCKISGALPRSN